MWVFRLNVTNGTDRTLSVSHPNLKWGYWYTNNKDNTKPVDIPAGKTVYALGLRAARGTWTGYECTCTWLDKGKNSLGAISIYVDVPYSANNASEMTASGVLDFTGWKDLPKRGHEFTKNITITAPFGALTATEDDTLAAVEDLDQDYIDLLEFEMASNRMMEHWSELEALAEIDQFNPKDVIPDEYLLPPKEKFIGRGAVVEIEKRDWAGVGDAKLPEPYHKKIYAKRYFAVPVYSLNTNPRSTETVPAGVEKTTMRSVEVASAIKSTLETNLSVKLSLTGEYSDPVVGAKVAAELESAFSLRSVTEKSTSRIERTEETIKIPAVDYDRLFVPWVFSTTVAIYCEQDNGDTRLVAISQWALEQLYRTYNISG